MKKSIATVLGMGVLGAGMLVSQASATINPVTCSENTTSWFGPTGPAGLSKTCYFSGNFGDNSIGNASASTLSGEISPGVKGLISDLISTNFIPNTWYVYASAIGKNTSGQNIAGCRADDESTEQGQSGVDGDGGCENGATHRLYMRMTQ